MRGFDPGPPTLLVGVVADTHVGEFVAALPPCVLDALSEVDLVLHAGDLTDPAVLDQLRDLAPVVAVQGNHDREAGVHLPRTAVIRVGGVTIGLVHGDRPRPVELAAAALSLATGRVQTLGLERHLVRSIGEVDVLVFGHLHLPVRRRVGDTLVFSPGGVHQIESDPGFSWSSPSGRASAFLRRRLPLDHLRPSVGLLRIERGAVEARVVPLPEPPPPTSAVGPHRKDRGP